MRFGLEESVIAKIEAIFACFPAITRAVIYGSRAKGNFKPGSDIDLTLHGDHLTSDMLSKVNMELDELNLPYTFDLSLFDKIENDNLRDHIHRIGKVFYEKAEQG